MVNLNWLWPSIDDLEDAKKAAHLGAGVAFTVAVITSAVTVMSMAGVKLFQGLVNVYSFIDAGLFLVIGLFIYRFSRIAAIAGLLLYVGEQIIMIKTSGFRLSIISILFTLHFIAGVRGTFDYHHLKKSEDESGTVPPQIMRPPAESEEAPKKKRVLIPVLLLVLAVLGAGAYFALSFMQKNPGTNSSPAVSESAASSPASAAPSVLPQAPAAGQRTFKMKDGKTVTGRVLREDEVYYDVETPDGRQEIVIKEDLA